MRGMALLVRRSAAPLGGAAIAAISIWLAVITMKPGLNLWPDLVTGLSSASVYTGALAAGFAAFEANRWAYANRDRIESGVRSPAFARVQHAVAVILSLLAGFVLALIVLAVYALTTGTYGSPSLAWLAALGGALILSAAFGYGAGVTVGKYWFVAPAATLLFYALFIFSRSAQLPYGVRSLFPAITNTDSVFVRYISTTMLGQLGFWVGLAALMVILVGGGWRRGSRSFAVIGMTVAAVIASIGGGMVIATNGQATAGYNSRDFVCKTREFTLCLNRGYAAAMNPLHAQLSEMNMRVEGTQLFADRLEQNVQGAGDEPAPGARSIYLEKLENEQDIAFAVYRYVAMYGGSRACTGSSSLSKIAILYVDSWLSGFYYSLEGLPEPERLEALREMSTDEAKAWFRSHAAQYFSCTLTLADLP